jgi:hypothetical protein
MLIRILAMLMLLIGAGGPALAGPRDAGGTWTVQFDPGARTTLTLRQAGDQISGILEVTDGSRKEVTGRLQGGVLELRRDTGLETIQFYRVRLDGDRFSGTFWNEGKYPGRGAFTGSRPGQPELSGVWTVTFEPGARTTLTLSQAGDQVSGILEVTDGSRREVTGRLEGRTLVLRRDTGLETVQHYRVTVERGRFSGTFWNEGKYPGKGSFTGSLR